MAQAPQLDFAEFIRQRKEARVGGGSETTGHEYSYALDRQTRASFEKIKGVELAVTSAVRVFREVVQGQLLGNAVRVSARQFTRIHRIAQSCADTLHIATPNVYMVSSPVMNAATYGTNEESFIMVHSALVEAYSDDELLTVIGHECGHIHNSHVVYLTALHMATKIASSFIKLPIEPAALVALRSWSRRAEITCDRAGMLCGKDAHAAARALTKLVVGSKRLYEEFDIDAFLEQYEEGKAGMGRYMEVFASHPWLPKRVLAMRTFAESELYRKAANAGSGGLTMKEVDDRVAALLKGDA